MNKLECAGWKKTSCDDGPGIRSVLFLQGCSMHCPGCQNSSTHNPESGSTKTVEEVLDFITANCRNKKITISGGEPLEQLKSLRILLKQLKRKGFNICLYTGWNFNQVPSDILSYLDYLKCGHFDSTRRDSRLMYVGSSNQTMYRNNHGIMEEINLYITEECA